MDSTFTIQFYRIDDERTDLIAFPQGEDPCDNTFYPPYTPEQFEVILRVLELFNRNASQYLSREDKLILKKIHDPGDGLSYWYDGKPLPDLPDRVGRRLYHALFTGNIGEAFRRQVFKENNTSPISLCLQFKPDDPNSARYPWELMRKEIDTPPLVFSEVLLSRHFLTGDPLSKLSFSSPLKVLTTVAHPQNSSSLKTSDGEIIEKMMKSDNHIEFEVSEPVFDSLLERAIDMYPEIIHFDGHGVFGRFCPECKKQERQTFLEWWETRCPETGCDTDVSEMPNEGFLIFEDNEGKSDYISAKRLSDRFSALKTKLFLLSACQTATIKHNSILNSLFNNVAPALVRAGIPAVVAMQFSVNAEETGKFTGRFYKSLNAGRTVETAVSDACRMLSAEEGFRPVLFLRTYSHNVPPDPEETDQDSKKTEISPNVKKELVALKRQLKAAQDILEILEEKVASFTDSNRPVELIRDYRNHQEFIQSIQKKIEDLERS